MVSLFEKYRKRARKDYLKYVRSRKHTAQKTREAIRKQLNYLRRDLKAIDAKLLKAFLARDEELDGLFERIYEDNVSGRLSDNRFAKMSRRYGDEQKELAEKIKKLRSEIEKQSSRSMTTDIFLTYCCSDTPH